MRECAVNTKIFRRLIIRSMIESLLLAFICLVIGLASTSILIRSRIPKEHENSLITMVALLFFYSVQMDNFKHFFKYSEMKTLWVAVILLPTLYIFLFIPELSSLTLMIFFISTITTYQARCVILKKESLKRAMIGK